MTEGQQAAMVAAYQAGASMREIAREHGVFIRDVSAAIGPLKRKTCRIIAAPVGPRALFSDIIEQTALVFGVTVAEIKGKCRKRRIVRPRQVVCYLAKRLIPGISYPVIGKLVGGRDHSTVMNACDKVGIFIDYYPEFAAYVDAAMIRSRADGKAARLRCAARMAEWERQSEPDPLPVVAPDPWWSMSDDDLMASRIAAHKARGGDFVEVWA